MAPRPPVEIDPDVEAALRRSGYDVLDCGVRETVAGPARYVRVHRLDMATMGYRELWDVLARACSGWGVQSFPPPGQLRDEANKYHFLVFAQAPAGFHLWPPGR